MRPIPISRVEPSSTRLARFSPIRRVTSVTSGGGTSTSGMSTGTSTSMSYTCRLESPCTRGICGFTCAMTRLAFSAAAFTTSTEMPRLQRPRSSGGDTWINATSIGNRPDLNSRGMSDRKMGV